MLLLLLALGACTPSASRPTATIIAASIAATPTPTLTADLRLALSPAMLEALDRGIALRLELTLRGDGAGGAVELRRGLKLRYLPLAQQYQLLDEGGSERSFARRSQLLAALDRVRVALPPEWAAGFERYTMALELDVSALPGPLRLPALYRSEWRLTSPEFRWRAGV